MFKNNQIKTKQDCFDALRQNGKDYIMNKLTFSGYNQRAQQQPSKRLASCNQGAFFLPKIQYQ